MNIEWSSREGVVVVGVDGSASANRALHWAAVEATRRHAVLRIVSAWSVPVSPWSVMAAAYTDPEAIEEGAERIVERAWSAVRRDLGDRSPTVETRTVHDGAAGGLIDVSRDADLLVVGTRGRGGFVDLLLGSVAASCAHHTPVPLVVIGRQAPDPGSGDIVVGVDDSDGARAALRWAAAEALCLGVGVRAVHGWDIPLAAPAGAPTFAPLADDDVAQNARAALEAMVREEIAELQDEPPISTEVVPSTAPKALIAAAERAALLVVGSRGRNGFVGLLLGSVSRQVLAHSPVPVVIIPRHEGEALHR